MSTGKVVDFINNPSNVSKAKELVDEALAEAAKIETWKPEYNSTNCVASPWDISQPWQPQTYSTTQFVIPPTPDFNVQVWKAENGYMVEINNKKYIAKKPEDIAKLFIKFFDAK